MIPYRLDVPWKLLEPIIREIMAFLWNVDVGGSNTNDRKTTGDSIVTKVCTGDQVPLMINM